MNTCHKYIIAWLNYMKCKVCNKECGKYVVCYDHRNTKYIDVCKLHGKTTFINRQCQKCAKLKEPVYLIKNNKDRFGKSITKNHFLFPYKDRLTNYSKKYQNQFMKRISHCSGIYGIFYKQTCLYIGQSVNISNRIHQHRENFKKAQHHINGTRAHKKRICISKLDHKVEYKYYEMAYKYKLNDLCFKTLMQIPKMNDLFIFNEILTYSEQAMIETYKPKFNHIAARPTRKENLKVKANMI